MIYKAWCTPTLATGSATPRLGTVYRYERSALPRHAAERGFTQDDAHIFCTHVRSSTSSRRDRPVQPWRHLRYGSRSISHAADKRSQRGDLGQATNKLKEALGSAASTRLVRGQAPLTGPRSTTLGSTRSARLDGPEIRSTSTCRSDSTSIRGEDGERHRRRMIHRTLLGS